MGPETGESASEISFSKAPPDRTRFGRPFGGGIRGKSWCLDKVPPHGAEAIITYGETGSCLPPRAPKKSVDQDTVSEQDRGWSFGTSPNSRQSRVWCYANASLHPQDRTGAGLGAKVEGRRNFEMGALTRAAGLVDAVLDHFNALWEGRCCESCKRHEVCPVPLEEPELG